MEDLIDDAVRQEQQRSATAQRSGQELMEAVRVFADEIAARPNLGLNTAPQRELERLGELGLLTAPLPPAHGGLGLGIEAGTQRTLLRLLAITGGADLALGRIVEGHVNGVLLVCRYGSEEQIARFAEEIRDGMLSGVWNTGGAEVLRLHRSGDRLRFSGIKTFATGAAFVRRPIVTAELEGIGWQMTVPRMEALGASLDRSFWHPLGMESSESFQIDFSNGAIAHDDLIGSGGDFYRDPMFRGGAIRFASVQAGAVLRLHNMFAQWLDERRRGDDPYQIARLGEIATLAQECVLWIERAAALAEQSFYRAEKQHLERMIEGANMMRTAIEQKSIRVMQLVTAGVGAHGLLQPFRFERVIRDLTMYLRQPAPDQAVAAIGRASIEKVHRRSTGTEWGLWTDEPPVESLPPRYFQRIYEEKRDPWDFETSNYERDKYDLTLQSLPRERYANALEVGCSVGVLTSRLAERCDRLLGLDVSERAIEQAQLRLAGAANVSFALMQVPNQLPDDLYDLIVVSEVAYYWQQADLERAVTRLAERQPAGGHLVLVHLTEYVPDYPLTGDQVHCYWTARPEWKQIFSTRRSRFRVDVLERVQSW